MLLCKYIKGRLGNQLFQYATMRAFQKQYFPDSDILLSFEKVKKKAKKENFSEIDSLRHFNTEYKSGKIKIKFKQKCIIFLLSLRLFINKYVIRKEYVKNRDIIEEKYKKRMLMNNIIWKTSGYTDFDISLINKNENILFYGYFESPHYFYGIKSIIQEDYKPKIDKLESNRKLYDIINNTNSVCISIRRGDFISNPKYRSIHYLCDEDYFKRAIEKMNKLTSNPQYIIFSDDINWVKNNMQMPENSIYENGNDPVWEKLRLMFSCKNFIISNSSFSWWAQFLSSYQNKIVIAPKNWNKRNDNRDRFESNWILI